MALEKIDPHDEKASEGEIRTALARFLITSIHDGSSVLASEAVYGFENRRADFIYADDYSHAYEIKSDFDTTLRLQAQISEYTNTFDYVSVLTTPRLLADVRKEIPRRVGLLVFRDRQIFLVRKAIQIRSLSKIHLAASISKSNLSQALSTASRTQSVDEIRRRAIRELTLQQLRAAFLEEMKCRFSDTTRLFLDEVDQSVEAEDLLLLRRGSRLSF